MKKDFDDKIEELEEMIKERSEKEIIISNMGPAYYYDVETSTDININEEQSDENSSDIGRIDMSRMN